MDCIVHGVSKSQTQLSDFHFHFSSEGTNAADTLISDFQLSELVDNASWFT